MATTNAPHVAILMGVCNGAATLAAQLESFAAQSHQNWSLVASDDGSRDEGPEMIRAFARRAAVQDVTLLKGPCQGTARNFLSLLDAVSDGESFAAFCDQDDCWFPDRLRRGIDALLQVPAGCPALYCSRTVIADANLRPLRLSPLRPLGPAFSNALVQNIASGNTILLNPPAISLLRKAAARTDATVAHDWWAYQIVSGAGGHVLHDEAPTVLYRQHGANQIGANDSARAMVQRIGMILSGAYRRWNDLNLKALAASDDLLTAENRALLRQVAALRACGPIRRLAGLHAAGLYRQSRVGTAALYAAAAFNRL